MIDRGPHPSVVTLDIFVNDSYLTTTSGDGLLISTPSGNINLLITLDLYFI
jgi:NAD kinase